MKIICIGRNYTEHAKEMKNEIPTEPVIFLKPDTALLKDNQPFFLPDISSEIHHEVELVLKICKTGKHIQEKFASKYYNEIGIGIDFTARDLQNKLKGKGLPWELAKAFDNSAPVGKFLQKDSFSDLRNIQFYLTINGNTVQKGNTADLLFSFDAIISFVSNYFTLREGDLIFTGTPQGVSTVKAGDKLEAYIENKKLLELMVK